MLFSISIIINNNFQRLIRKYNVEKMYTRKLKFFFKSH